MGHFGQGTEILGFDGFIKKIEDISVGDLLMGQDSRPRQVLSITEGSGELYKVCQRTFEDYFVHENHTLAIRKSDSAFTPKRLMPSGNFRSPYGMYPKYGQFINMNVVEFFNTSQSFKRHFHGYKTELIKFPCQSVDINPYFLGLWLGDGTSREIAITTMDQEIIDYLYSFLKIYPELHIGVSHSKKENKSKIYHLRGTIQGHVRGTCNPLIRLFKQNKLIQNKHVPQQYIANTEKIRLLLLAGLLDTDGFLNTNGYDIIQKNEKLIDQIKLVADTLGFRTVKKEIWKTCQTGAKNKYFNLSINGLIWKIPCRIPRKIIKKENVHKNKNFLINELKIENCGHGKYFNLAVDGGDLFCLKDGTVVC